MKLTELKKWLKKHYMLYDVARFFCFRNERINFVLRRLTGFPVLHCDYSICHGDFGGLGTVYPRTVPHNLKNPQLFNEKLLWLKYYNYNKNELCAKCYDKYAVREYVEACGCGQYLNELYGVWDSFDNIPWDDLPDDYVLKLTNGSGGAENHLFKHKGDVIDVAKLAEKFKLSSREQRKYFESSGDLLAIRLPQKYICEKLLQSSGGYDLPTDYKVYCFNGEPQYLLMIWDRKATSIQEAFYKIDPSASSGFTSQSDFFDTAQQVEIQRPACYDEIMDICRKLSKPFPFVRVDLYIQDNRPVFGELTFTPAGSLVLYHVFDKDKNVNYKALTEMGKLLKLEGL